MRQDYSQHITSLDWKRSQQSELNSCWLVKLVKILASGGSLGMGFLGGSALGLRPWPGWGIGDSWMLFLWRRHAALLGMPVPADVGCQPGGRTVPGLVRGGGLGIWGRSASGLGLRLAWGAWVLVGVPPGAWVGACAWARLWCGGLRCIGASSGGRVQ